MTSLNTVLQAMPQQSESHKYIAVIMVLAIIFAGIVAYLVSIDRKLRKLEKERKA